MREKWPEMPHFDVFFLGLGWPWVGELVGFLTVLTCLPTQQILENRKHPMYKLVYRKHPMYKLVPMGVSSHSFTKSALGEVCNNPKLELLALGSKTIVRTFRRWWHASAQGNIDIARGKSEFVFFYGANEKRETPCRVFCV